MAIALFALRLCLLALVVDNDVLADGGQFRGGISISKCGVRGYCCTPGPIAYAIATAVEKTTLGSHRRAGVQRAQGAPPVKAVVDHETGAARDFVAQPTASSKHVSAHGHTSRRTGAGMCQVPVVTVEISPVEAAPMLKRPPFCNAAVEGLVDERATRNSVAEREQRVAFMRPNAGRVGVPARVVSRIVVVRPRLAVLGVAVSCILVSSSVSCMVSDASC